MTTIFVVVLVAALYAATAQPVPLSASQHSALMSVYNSLGSIPIAIAPIQHWVDSASFLQNVMLCLVLDSSYRQIALDP